MKYRLKKDAPMDKAGTIFELHDDCEFKWLASDGCETQYQINLIDNFDEWFEPVTNERIKDAELDMKTLDIKYRKRQHFWCMVALWVAVAYLAVGILNNVITMNKLAGLGESSEQQAQCQSLGGVYDGKQCWYAGKVTSIDDLMERLYGD